MEELAEENRKLRGVVNNSWLSARRWQSALRLSQEKADEKAAELVEMKRRLEQENTRMRKETAAMKARLMGWRQLQRRGAAAGPGPPELQPPGQSLGGDLLLSHSLSSGCSLVASDISSRVAQTPERLERARPSRWATPDDASVAAAAAAAFCVQPVLTGLSVSSIGASTARSCATDEDSARQESVSSAAEAAPPPLPPFASMSGLPPHAPTLAVASAGSPAGSASALLGASAKPPTPTARPAAVPKLRGLDQISLAASSEVDPEEEPCPCLSDQQGGAAGPSAGEADHDVEPAPCAALASSGAEACFFFAEHGVEPGPVGTLASSGAEGGRGSDPSRVAVGASPERPCAPQARVSGAKACAQGSWSPGVRSPVRSPEPLLKAPSPLAREAMEVVGQARSRAQEALAELGLNCDSSRSHSHRGASSSRSAASSADAAAALAGSPGSLGGSLGSLRDPAPVPPLPRSPRACVVHAGSFSLPSFSSPLCLNQTLYDRYLCSTRADSTLASYRWTETSIGQPKQKNNKTINQIMHEQNKQRRRSDSRPSQVLGRPAGRRRPRRLGAPGGGLPSARVTRPQVAPVASRLANARGGGACSRNMTQT